MSGLVAGLAPAAREEPVVPAARVTVTVTVTATAIATTIAVGPEGEIVTREVDHGAEREVDPDFGTEEMTGVTEAVHVQDGSHSRTTIGPAKRPPGVTVAVTAIAETTDVIAAVLAIESDRGRLVLELTVGKGLARY